MLTYQISNDGYITFFAEGRPWSVGPDHPSAENLKRGLLTNSLTEEEAVALTNTKKALEIFAKASGLQVVSENDELRFFWKGREIHNSLTDRIVELQRGKHSVDSLVAFLENLMKNPSKRSVDQLYEFLRHKHLPITEDGHFLAYKSVRADLTDHYSGTVSNAIGSVIETERNEVDDDPNVGCSYGFHVGSIEYVRNFGARKRRFLVCKVNPADVVAVPHDCGFQKVRTCRYEVIGELSQDEVLDASPVYSASVKDCLYSPVAPSYYDDSFDGYEDPFEEDLEDEDNWNLLYTNWMANSRDFVVDVAQANSLIRTKEEGRRLGKSEVCKLLATLGLLPAGS